MSSLLEALRKTIGTEDSANTANTANTANVENVEKAAEPARIRRYRVTLVDGKTFTALATAEQDEEADRIEFELHWGTRLLLLERVS